MPIYYVININETLPCLQSYYLDNYKFTSILNVRLTLSVPLSNTLAIFFYIKNISKKNWILPLDERVNIIYIIECNLLLQPLLSMKAVKN